MKKILIILVAVLMLESCGVYSFSGANISPEIKTISVSYINNKSGNGPAAASDILTNMLKDKMNVNTGLTMVNANGDVQFSGDITKYDYSIQAPSGTTSSDLRRITVSVTITFYNSIDEEDGFENQTFTRYADYPVDEDLTSVEETIITEIGTQLVDDIFNKAFVKW